MKYFVVAILFSVTSLFGAEPNGPHATKFGVGFAGQSGELSIHAELATPSLFLFKTNNDKMRTDFHLYFEVGDHYVNNLAQLSGLFYTVNNGILSSGLRMQNTLLDGSGVVSPYSTIGAELAFVSATLATNNTSLGLRVGFGCDLFFVRGVDTFLGTSDSSFFVEGNVTLLHRRADKIAGEPRWREGFYPRVGMRTHF